MRTSTLGGKETVEGGSGEPLKRVPWRWTGWRAEHKLRAHDKAAKIQETLLAEGLCEDVSQLIGCRDVRHDDLAGSHKVAKEVLADLNVLVLAMANWVLGEGDSSLVVLVEAHRGGQHGDTDFGDEGVQPDSLASRFCSSKVLCFTGRQGDAVLENTLVRDNSAVEKEQPGIQTSICGC